MKAFAIISLILAALTLNAEELSVAAAADLNFALPEIAKQYQHDTGNTLRISFGSSGNFYTQIQNGAPFDLFFSADVDFPRKLEASHQTVPDSLYEYATGKIVLWVPNNSKLNLNLGMKVLLDPAIKKIAIANPTHAPYGRAAEAALRKAGIYDKVADKLVLGENISQAAQFVDTGNADIGLLALSLAMSPTMQSRGHYVEVPSDLYPPLHQAAVIVGASQKKALAKQFLDYLKKPKTKAILKKFGFE